MSLLFSQSLHTIPQEVIDLKKFPWSSSESFETLEIKTENELKRGDFYFWGKQEKPAKRTWKCN